jgi:MinD-like ATPase involved in chromosome partitioning or flagellar assembly
MATDDRYAASEVSVPGNGEPPRPRPADAPASTTPSDAAGTGVGHGTAPMTGSEAPNGQASPGTGRASDEFTDSVYLGPAADLPEDGWRRWLYDVTRHRINPGPSGRQLREERLLIRVRRPVAGCRRIAVVARKGGVGKTTVALGLGHVLASARHDRTVAIDANPDAGTLGYRMPNLGAGTITDLVRDGDRIRRYSDARLYTAFAPSRLEVVSSSDDPTVTRTLTAEHYRGAIEVLERHYNLVISDTGSDMTHPVTQAVLDAADQLVVVVAGSLDGARAAAHTLDWLESNGYGQLTQDAVAVLNGIRPRPTVDLDRIWAHFTARVRAVERVPYDSHLEAGGQADLDALAPATRHAFVRVAAAVMDGFAPPAPAEEAPTIVPH